MSTVVLLRGLAREAGHWGGFVELLQRQMPGSTLVTLDLPGTGRLAGQRSPRTVAEICAHGRAQLLELGLTPPYVVVALSLGAMVAVAWAQSHPSELSAAVLINTSLRPFSAFYRRLRPRNYGQLLRAGLLWTDAARRERIILRLTSRRFADSAALLQDWVDIARQRPVARGTALRQLLAAARYRAPRQPPAVPLLLLASQADGLVDARCSRQLASRWQCAVAMHASAGHDLPLDDGPWVAARIGNWLAAQPAALAGHAPPPTAAPPRG